MATFYFSNSTRKVFLYVSSYMLLCFIFSCAAKKKDTGLKPPKENETRTVTRAESFENLVILDSLGVTGADGVISFPLDSTSSVFMMGDSFLAPVRNQKRDVKSPMINNTFIVINDNERTHYALFRGTRKNPNAFLTPDYGNPREYYWPGDGFVNNGIAHVFMSRFLKGNQAWGFKFSGTDYIRLDANTLEVLSQEDFPYSNRNGVHYGHALLPQDEYTYLYGTWSTQDSTALHIARGKLTKGGETLGAFQFFNGKDWVPESINSAPLSGIKQPVPEQFSVFQYGDVYILILQARELGNGNIFSYIANKPTGPWRNERLLYHTTEQENTEHQVFTYNAMAHPQYIRDEKVLVSYCVNSFEVANIHEINTDYYRPRFVWVPLEMILE